MAGPIEQVIQRHGCTPTVAARLRRLNPDLRNGDLIRGLHRKPLSWRRAKRLLQDDATLRRPFRMPNGWIYDPLVAGPITRLNFGI